MPKKFTTTMPADISYEWRVQPDGRAALIFNKVNKAMWSVLELKAASRNKTAQQLIDEIIVRSLITDHEKINDDLLDACEQGLQFVAGDQPLGRRDWERMEATFRAAIAKATA
jgi:hypothetical protein